MDLEYKSWAFESSNTTVVLNESRTAANRTLQESSSLLLLQSSTSSSGSNRSHRSQDSGFSDSDLQHLESKPVSPSNSEKNLLTSPSSKDGDGDDDTKSIPNKSIIFNSFQRNETSRISSIPTPYFYSQKRHSQIITNPHLLTAATPIAPAPIPCTSTPKPLAALTRTQSHPPSLKMWLAQLADSFETEITVNLQSTPILSRLRQQVNELSAELIRPLQSLVKHMNTIQELFDSFRLPGNSSATMLKQLVGNITEFVLIINLAANRSIVEHRKRDKLLEACDVLVKEADARTWTEEDHLFFKSAAKDMFNIYGLIAAESVKFHIQELLEKLESSRNNEHLKTRAILNTFMILMLQQYQYQNTGSLMFEKIVELNAPRTFLTICIECKASTVRTLALRCLTIVCSTTDAIRKFEKSGGMDILSDILSECGRPEPELSEAAAVLVQITATWLPFDTRISSIEKKLIASMITSITRFVQTTNCCQNLLLCIAALANLTEIEPEFAIPVLIQFRSIEKVLNSLRNHCKPKIALFLQEQTTLLILNSSQLAEFRYKLIAEPYLLKALFGFLQQQQLSQQHAGTGGCSSSSSASNSSSHSLSCGSSSSSGSGGGNSDNDNENIQIVQQKIHYRAALALNRFCLDTKVVQKLIDNDGVFHLVQLLTDSELDDTTKTICLDIVKTISDKCHQLPLDTQLTIQKLLRNLKS